MSQPGRGGSKGQTQKQQRPAVRIGLSLLGPVSRGFEAQPGCSWSGARQAGGGQEARPPNLWTVQARVTALGWDGPCTGPGLGQTVCGKGRGCPCVVVVDPGMAEAEDPGGRQVLPTLGVQMARKPPTTGWRTCMPTCLSAVPQGSSFLQWFTP